MKRHDPEWRPICFVTDACAKEMLAIRTVFGDTMQIFICTWHMQRAACTKLLKTVRTLKLHQEWLGPLHLVAFIYKICNGLLSPSHYLITIHD